MIALFDDFLAERKQIGRLLLAQLYRTYRHPFGNRKNRTFLRLHNRLVCGLHCLLKRIGQYLHVNLIILCNNLGKPAKQLGKNDAGITSRSAEGTGGNCLCKRLHVRLCHRRHFLRGRHDRHRHVGTGISIWNREYIQFVDPLFLCFQVFRSGQKRFCESLGIYRSDLHLKNPP